MSVAGTAAPTPRTLRALRRLKAKPLNFDLARLPELIRAGGWHVDDLRQPLRREPPGDPIPDGPWEQARQVMSDYQAADPSMVRAAYDPQTPFPGRDMLLELRFGPLRFHAGVRVGEVYEDDRFEAGRRARIFGWNYRTLAGHFEQGQMAYEVWKWTDTGEVEFHIHAASRVAQSGNPILRLGFRLIGRPQQLRFYRNACTRMEHLVSARLRGAA